jgi:hypothetical protein
VNPWLEKFAALQAESNGAPPNHNGDVVIAVKSATKVDDSLTWISEIDGDGRITHRRQMPASPMGEPTAVKGFSDILGAAIWVVADNLPQGEWPDDGCLVYTHREVRQLLAAGQDTLPAVHMTKQTLSANVVSAKGRIP